MKIVSNRDNLNAYHKQSKRYDINQDKYINNVEDDMVVISKDKFDDIYNSPDWVQNQNVDENEQLNYQQLARYDDIVELIEDDKSHMTNFDNFQKNSNRFYGSIRDQIFAETARIISADDVLPESHDEIADIDDVYSTRNPDVDKIISIAANQDKSYLDLINNPNAKLQLNDFKSFDYDNNDFDKKRITRDEINDVPAQPKDFTNAGLTDEQKAKLDMISEYQKMDEEVVQSTANDKLDSKQSTPSESVSKTPNHVNTSSQSVQTPPPIPNQSEPAKSTSSPSVSAQNISSPKQETPVSYSTDPLKPINAGPTVRPYVKPTPTSSSVSTKPKYEKPKLSVDDTEYMKIKRIIDKYEKETRDAIATGVSSKITVSDSLKVNLYNKFYMDESDLFNVKLAQDKKMESILKEYEDTLAQNKLYETQKKLDEIYDNKKNTDSPVEAINDKLKSTADEAQRVKAENDELKQKIKELEEKMKNNISSQKNLANQKIKLEAEVNNQKQKMESDLKPIVTKSENLKPQKDVAVDVIQEVISDEDYKVPPSMDPKRLNQIKNNTLKGIHKFQGISDDEIPRPKKTINQADYNLANKKPIKFSEKGAFNNDLLNPNSNSNYERILAENPTMSSLEKAINAKKEKLFQSFTQEFRVPSDAERYHAKQASKRILDGLDDDYEVVSIKDATSKKKN